MTLESKAEWLFLIYFIILPFTVQYTMWFLCSWNINNIGENIYLFQKVKQILDLAIIS